MGARDTALSVLSACRKAGAWSDGALRQALRRDGLDRRDAALATQLCFGVLQNRMLLDHWIDRFSRGKLQPVVRDILRIAVYQIMLMDRIPPSAAVNEAVEQVKRRGRPKAAGLVNAVLRKFVVNRQDMPTLPEGSPAERLSVRYSHPKWLVQRILVQLGEEETEAFLRCNNEIIPTTIQTNHLKATDEQLEKELHLAGVNVERHPWLPGCFLVSGTGDLERLDAFSQGHFLVQDAAARLVALAAQPAPGSRILDVCAAPGGKSFDLAIDMGDRGDILACDVHPHKLQLMERSAARLGITCVRTALADGSEAHVSWQGQADLVVADVPCSGLGIIRKKPDIRYKDPKELERLPEIQRAILENAAAYVRPGGTLIYSTCTVLRSENEDVTDGFLSHHPDFVREAFSLPQPIGTVGGQITLWPQRLGTDGFYICKMRRQAEETT